MFLKRLYYWFTGRGWVWYRLREARLNQFGLDIWDEYYPYMWREQ